MAAFLNQKDRVAAVSPKDHVLIGFNQNGPLKLDAITGRIALPVSNNARKCFHSIAHTCELDVCGV